MKRLHLLPALAALFLAPHFAVGAAAATPARPNVLFIIADDASRHFGAAYDRNWVKTPNIDRIPFVVNWPGRIAQPGCRIADFISFIDLAPTFLEVFGVNGPAQGMAPITGRSFTDLLRGQAKVDRGFVIVGRVRIDVLARPAGEKLRVTVN